MCRTTSLIHVNIYYGRQAVAGIAALLLWIEAASVKKPDQTVKQFRYEGPYSSRYRMQSGK